MIFKAFVKYPYGPSKNVSLFGSAVRTAIAIAKIYMQIHSHMREERYYTDSFSFFFVFFILKMRSNSLRELYAIFMRNYIFKLEIFKNCWQRKVVNNSCSLFHFCCNFFPKINIMEIYIHPWVSTKKFSPIGPDVWPAIRNIYIYIYECLVLLNR